MDNYKIKVKDEAESKEAISLLIQLGYKDSESDRFGFVYTIGEKIGCDFFKHWEYYSSQGCKELTLPQLRDLVVLKRNDVKDANYTYAGNPVLKLETQDYKVWDEAKQAWLEHIGSQTDLRRGLKAILKAEKDPALISGADALDALKAKKEVEYCGAAKTDSWLPAHTLPVVYFLTDSFKFRLKPQTIKVELELPKPFEPKEGDEYFYISTLQNCLYSHDVWSDEPADITQAAFGAYRTEDDVKKAVEQLRNIRGTNS